MQIQHLEEVIKIACTDTALYGHEDLQGDISFFDFLKEHYNNPEAHPDIPNHHHDNLPLKHSLLIQHLLYHLFNFNVVSTTFIESDQTTNFYQEGNFINNYLSQMATTPLVNLFY